MYDGVKAGLVKWDRRPEKGPFRRYRTPNGTRTTPVLNSAHVTQLLNQTLPRRLLNVRQSPRCASSQQRTAMADGVQIFRSDEDLLRDSAEHGRPSRERYSDTFEGGDDELRTVSRSSSTASFVIAAETLSSPSPRPRHLESRLESRNPLHYSAESNRNAFLEERRARLRQHLNRIDEVLERNQRRLDDEVSLKRDSLTQKLRDVERNRLKLHEQKHLSAKRLRQRTTSSVADGAGEPPAAATNEKAKREEAASILQAVWRQQKYRQLVAEMSRRKLSLGSIKGLSFMDLVGKIQQPSTNKSMARFLLGIRAASAESSRIDFKNPARVFLSAYVIVSHPSEIIHSEGPAESELKECAQRMLDAFERLSADTGSGTAAAKVFSDALLVFVGRWVEYYRAFDAWKQADTHKIVGELIAHWLELERLWLSVRAEMHADSEWRGRVEHQQEQIRTRISKIAGEAGIARLVEESRRSRAEMGLGDEVEDDLESPAVPKLEDGPGVDNVPSSPPRTASVPGSAPGTPPRKSSTGPYSSSPSRFPSSMEKRAMAKLSDSVTNSRAGSATGTPTRNLSRTSSIAEPMASSSGQPSPSAQGMQLDDMGQFFGGLGATMGSNEQLAHELVMNPDFQLQPSKRSPLEESIRTAARKAFFDSIREDFAKGDYSRFALGLIDEAKNVGLFE